MNKLINCFVKWTNVWMILNALFFRLIPVCWSFLRQQCTDFNMNTHFRRWRQKKLNAYIKKINGGIEREQISDKHQNFICIYTYYLVSIFIYWHTMTTSKNRLSSSCFFLRFRDLWFFFEIISCVVFLFFVCVYLCTERVNNTLSTSLSCTRIWAKLFPGCCFCLFVSVFLHVCWCLFLFLFFFQLWVEWSVIVDMYYDAVFHFFSLLLARKDRHSEIGIIALASTDDKRYGWWFFGWAVRNMAYSLFSNSIFSWLFSCWCCMYEGDWHITNFIHTNTHTHTHTKDSFTSFCRHTMECLLFVCCQSNTFYVIFYLIIHCRRKESYSYLIFSVLLFSVHKFFDMCALTYAAAANNVVQLLPSSYDYVNSILMNVECWMECSTKVEK